MIGCHSCGGYKFGKPLCGGIAGNFDSRIMHRCRCNDTSMQKAKFAFEWVGYIVAIINKQKADFPED